MSMNPLDSDDYHRSELERLRKDAARILAERNDCVSVPKGDYAELVAALEACEFADNSGEEYAETCPVCRALRRPHKSDCIVGAALAKVQR